MTQVEGSGRQISPPLNGPSNASSKQDPPDAGHEPAQLPSYLAVLLTSSQQTDALILLVISLAQPLLPRLDRVLQDLRHP